MRNKMKTLFNLAIAMNLFAAIISLIAHSWGLLCNRCDVRMFAGYV